MQSAFCFAQTVIEFELIQARKINYKPKDFIALSNEVEQQGGKLLLGPCTGKPISYKVPVAGKRVRKNYFTTHCGTSARMEIPYDSSTHVLLEEDNEGVGEQVIIVDHPGEKHPKDEVATVCAVDDCVGLWPRFAEVVSEDSYQPHSGIEKELKEW